MPTSNSYSTVLILF